MQASPQDDHVELKLGLQAMVQAEFGLRACQPCACTAAAPLRLDLPRNGSHRIGLTIGQIRPNCSAANRRLSHLLRDSAVTGWLASAGGFA